MQIIFHLETKASKIEDDCIHGICQGINNLVLNVRNEYNYKLVPINYTLIIR